VFLVRFFDCFHESSLYKEYRDYEGVTDEEYEEAWAALREIVGPATLRATGVGDEEA